MEGFSSIDYTVGTYVDVSRNTRIMIVVLGLWDVSIYVLKIIKNQKVKFFIVPLNICAFNCNKNCVFS